MAALPHFARGRAAARAPDVGGDLRWVRLRMRAIGGLLLAALAALLGRAAQLQITQGSRLTRLAREQYLLKIAVTGKRGEIVDRSGAVLAASAPVESVYADLSQLDDPRALRLLADALHLGSREVESLSRRLDLSSQFAWIRRQVSPAEAEAVRKLQIPGVGMVKESRRFYPERELAAQVLGLVGVDGEGLEGLEKRYDEQLRGHSAELTASRDAKGRELSPDAVNAPELAGSSIQLTLDRNLQYAAEHALAQGLATTKANGGVAAILDPDTGAVLALAVGPSFNPNAVAERDRGAVRDRAVADAFEPGSTFKAFLVAAALEERIINPRTILLANGSFEVNDWTVHDHRAFGWLSVPQVLEVSSNIGAAKIGLLLGREKLARYLHDFGFGQRTEIELPGEVRGDLPRLRSDIATATASFGQGLTATPIQLMQGYVALANGGRLLRPYLVSRIIAPDGSAVDLGPAEIRQVITPQTARTLTTMLEKVVQKGGTAVEGAVPGYKVAGKTGTAQKVDPLTGTYSPDKRFSSFVGYLPADAPRAVIGVFLDEPKGEHYGGKIAAPIFRDLAAETMRQMGIGPDPGAIADVGRKSDRPIKASLPGARALASSTQAGGEGNSSAGTQAGGEGNSSAGTQAGGEGNSSAGTQAGGGGNSSAGTQSDSSEDDDVLDEVSSGGGVPRVLGLPLRAALNELRAAGLSAVPEGSGCVVAQRPKPGAPAPQNHVVALTLARAGTAPGDR